MKVKDERDTVIDHRIDEKCGKSVRCGKSRVFLILQMLRIDSLRTSALNDLNIFILLLFKDMNYSQASSQ